MRNWFIAAATALAVGVGSVFAGSAQADPVVAPVTGIPAPCAATHPFPDDAGIDAVAEQLSDHFGFALAGSQWTEERRPSIKILWETLDAMECTGYRAALQSKVRGTVGINAARVSGYAWGDWSLTKSGYVTFDFSKFARALESGDDGRLTRLVAHELAHVLNSDRGSNPGYWSDFTKLFKSEGRFSSYAGSSVTETFADVIGYYVGRCALNNPYDTGAYDAYYAYARDYIFDGKEFGPPPGEKADCTVPADGAVEPQPASTSVAWLEGLSGE